MKLVRKHQEPFTRRSVCMDKDNALCDYLRQCGPIYSQEECLLFCGAEKNADTALNVCNRLFGFQYTGEA